MYTWKTAVALDSGEWDILDEFEAPDYKAAEAHTKEYAEVWAEEHDGQELEWYILNADDENMNG